MYSTNENEKWEKIVGIRFPRYFYPVNLSMSAYGLNLAKEVSSW